MKVDPKGNWAWKLFVSPFFLVDAFIETAILMNSEQYKAENVYDGNSVEIPNSAFFNNPLAQNIYATYLYNNVKDLNGDRFFVGGVDDIVGEWQAHNLAFWGLSVLKIASNSNTMLKILEILLTDEKDLGKAKDVNMGKSINEDIRPEVKFVSNIFKWINKILRSL